MFSKIDAMRLKSKNIIYYGESKAEPFGIQIHNFYDFFENS